MAIPDTITGGDFEKASEITTTVKSGREVELSARLDAKAGILPSMDSIKTDVGIAQEAGKEEELVGTYEGATYMLLGSVSHIGASEVLSSLRIVETATGRIAGAGDSTQTGGDALDLKTVTNTLREAWTKTNALFQKNTQR